MIARCQLAKRSRSAGLSCWRYRWPDEVRDEVLARLLALNAQRAEEERLAGKAGDSPKKKAGRGGKGKKKGRPETEVEPPSLWAEPR